ncbi:MAG: GNAT family N-acetyltransferase [Gammaproteobacteria bacterium]
MIRFSKGEPIKPILSLAHLADFDAIHAIWMQEDVLPFLGWEKTSREDFRPIFDEIRNASELYVLRLGDEVVAVRRIVLYDGQHSHTAELGAFAVHQDHRRKGYGELFYKLLMEEIKTNKPNIKRIQLGQTTDNFPALVLSEKMGFTPDFIFPDRPRRKTGPQAYINKWHMGSRYMTYVIDKTIVDCSIKNADKFSLAIPDLNPNKTILENISIEMTTDGKKAVCYYHDEKIATFTFARWARRFSHIQYWEVQKEPMCDKLVLEACFRKLAFDASIHCKKIEIFSADQDLSDVLKNLGGHYCGTKKGGCKMGDQYYDEIAVNISFFNIKDALELMNIYVKNSEKELKASLALINCQKNIKKAFSENYIDKYAALFLENMAYHMVREGLGEGAIRRYGQEGQDPQPWDSLINALPSTIDKEAFENLNNIIFKADHVPSRTSLRVVT